MQALTLVPRPGTADFSYLDVDHAVGEGPVPLLVQTEEPVLVEHKIKELDPRKECVFSLTLYWGF